MLIAHRGQSVEQAAKVKAGPDAVFDSVRFDQIIARVRRPAEDVDVSPDVVEAVYRAMAMAFTEREKSLVQPKP